MSIDMTYMFIYQINKSALLGAVFIYFSFLLLPIK